jgi:hypothetical protein
MLTIVEVLSGKITLDIECVDRVYLSGYVKYLQMPGRLVNFIREQIGWPIPPPKALYEMTTQFRDAVEHFATEQGPEIVTFGKDDAKDEVAQAHLARFEGQSAIRHIA